MSEADLAALRDQLEADRRRTSDLIASLDQNFASIVEAADLTATDDEHDPEGATIAFERSQTSAVLATAISRLADIDDALTRLADGTYGICERCLEPILRERLFARPAARTCINCAI